MNRLEWEDIIVMWHLVNPNYRSLRDNKINLAPDICHIIAVLVGVLEDDPISDA